MAKIIISCAITGSIHTPTMSPHLPFRPEDIAGQAIGAAKAGAAILHLHARDPETGHPSADPAHFMGFLPAIRAGCDAVVNLTTGGSAIMTLDQRLAGPMRAAPEMCSLNMGSMNFALYPMLARHADWRFDWEETVPRRHRRSGLQEHAARHRPCAGRDGRQARRAVRVRMLRHRPSDDAAPFRRPRAWSRRRSSSSSSSGCWAAWPASRRT